MTFSEQDRSTSPPARQLTMNQGLKFLALLVVGLVTLVISLYLLASQIYFVSRATAFEAPIVEVNLESVRRGKGSTVAYVPTVEIADETGKSTRAKVDTFNQEPVFRVGEKMPVLCDRSSLRCIKNTFFGMWGNSALAFILSLVFFSIALIYYRRVRERTVQGSDLLSIKSRNSSS